MPERVFLLHHVHEMPDGEDNVKLIGVYATEADARAAIARVRNQPGFAECPEGFEVNDYDIGMDHWTEGYVTLRPEDM